MQAGEVDKLRTTWGATIAEYRVICVVRRADGAVRAVGYSKSGNGVMYDDTLTVEQARRAIEQGDRLYIVSPSTGARKELEQSIDSDLDHLPPCG